MMVDWHWATHTFRAMNTEAYVRLYTTAANSTEILNDVEALFRSVERRLSRFDPHSDLSRLNQADSGAFVANPTLLEAVRAALWAAEATGGLFDPTILPYLTQAGYNRSFETITPNKPGNPKSLPPKPGKFREVELNRTRLTITRPTEIQLDLGGIGKGWTVDRAADRLNGLGDFIINAGGDLYAHGFPPGMPGWHITVPHPLDHARIVTELWLHNQSAATSTIARRQWRQGGQPMHHLIDPRTGEPAQTDLLSVTVIGRRAAIAEVFAKTALIIGSREGLAYLESIPNVEGLLITQDDRLLTTSGLTRYQKAKNPLTEKEICL